MPWAADYPEEDHVLTSPDGRFTIEWDWDRYDKHDINWILKDAKTGEILWTFHGDVTDVTVKKVVFDKTGRFVVATDGYGEVMRKISLSDFE